MEARVRRLPFLTRTVTHAVPRIVSRVVSRAVPRVVTRVVTRVATTTISPWLRVDIAPAHRLRRPWQDTDGHRRVYVFVPPTLAAMHCPTAATTTTCHIGDRGSGLGSGLQSDM